MGRGVKRGRGLVGRIDGELAQAELARGVRKADRRKRNVAGPAMAAHDGREVFMRALGSFYGEGALRFGGERVEDVPRLLGREEEFWAYWREFERVGVVREDREVELARAAAVRTLSGYF